jgi:hypothetical protein
MVFNIYLINSKILYDKTDLYIAYKKGVEFFLYDNDHKLVAKIDMSGKKFNSESKPCIEVIYFFIKESGILFDKFGNCSLDLKKSIINTIKSFSNIIKPVIINYNGKKLNSSKETEVFLKYYSDFGEIIFGEIDDSIPTKN